MTATFKQKDLERAWKAAVKVGLPISQTLVEPDGTIRLVHEGPTEQLPKSPDDIVWTE